MPTKNDAPAPEEQSAPAPGAESLQRETDAATEQGFIGIEVDPTPNEHYTVQGVTSGKPTPETDAGAKAAATEHAAKVAAKVAAGETTD